MKIPIFLILSFFLSVSAVSASTKEKYPNSYFDFGFGMGVNNGLYGL
ncbi:MAG: hypothetical protein HND54_03545 [Bacteroidetes bacterium]|nr:hypothetical protein [Bacteroidota bacterium]